jgi:hypothetical protein
MAEGRASHPLKFVVSFDGAGDIFAQRGHFSRSPIDKNWGVLASGLDHDSSTGGRQPEQESL